MRDRLIELMMEAQKKNNETYMEYVKRGYEGDSGNALFVDIADHLLANGVIVPPVKIGQTVYFIYDKKIIKGTVRLIRPFIDKEKTIFKGNVIGEFKSVFYEDGRKEEYEVYVVFEKPFGSERVAYLTKEEAEEKLKELSENDT